MKILIATDGSEFSDAAIDEVLRYHTRAETEVMIVAVVEPLVNTVGAPFGVLDTYYASYLKDARERAAKVLEKAEKRFRDGSGERAKVSSKLLIGKAGQEIVEAATKWPADLIAVGSHGRGFWERAYLGSVSNAVTHHAPCNVLVVRGDATTDVGEEIP